jgi:RNA polymerase sigma factor (sigma-70 family)
MANTKREHDQEGPDIADLLARHLPALQAFLRLRAGKLIRAKESMADLAQSVCRELLASPGFEYQNDAACKRWLCTAAMRKLVERQRYYRRDKRDALREAAPSTDADAQWFDAYRTIATPSQHAAAHEFVAIVDAAMDELPEHYREVIALTRGLGLSQKDAAAELGKTEVAVQRLLTRALVKLAGLLRAKGLETG